MQSWWRATALQACSHRFCRSATGPRPRTASGAAARAACGVGAGPVPADQLRSRARAPATVSSVACLPVRQHVHRAAGLHVHQHRRVRAAPRRSAEVIHAEHPRQPGRQAPAAPSSIRTRVCRLTSTASSCPASRAAGRPASASCAAVASAAASGGVFRARQLASPAGCSANVPFPQPPLPHLSRRTPSQRQHPPPADARIRQPPRIPVMHPRQTRSRTPGTPPPPPAPAPGSPPGPR